MARLGYGYNRSRSDFDRARVDQVFLDTKDTDRLGRMDLLRIGLRQGDTLVLLARGDLGRGGELPAIYSLLRERGVTVEIFDEKTPGKRGRPPGIEWPEGVEDEARRMWHDMMYSGPYVIRWACEKTGTDDETVMRNFFNANFGPRSKPKDQ